MNKHACRHVCKLKMLVLRASETTYLTLHFIGKKKSFPSLLPIYRPYRELNEFFVLLLPNSHSECIRNNAVGKSKMRRVNSLLKIRVFVFMLFH